MVVCAYTELRWEQTRAAVESVLGQEPGPAQVLLVVDHNADLAARARHELHTATVLESEGPVGLSGARNTGLRAATQPITAFLDDGVAPWVSRAGWTYLVEPFRSPNIVATGGSAPATVAKLSATLAAAHVRLGRWLQLPRAAGLGGGCA